MLFNNETKKFEIILMDLGDGMVTGDSIRFNKTYHLIYKLSGYDEFIYTFTGEELALRTQSYFQTQTDNLYNVRFIDISRQLNMYLTLYSTYKISKSHYKKIKKNYDKSIVKFVKKNDESFNEHNNSLKTLIATYLYIKLTGYNGKRNTKHTVMVNIDHDLTDKLIKELKETWQDDRIVEVYNIKSFDEYLKYNEFGRLYFHWYDNLVAYHCTSQAE